MDRMRINCAHDDAESWSRMIGNSRTTSSALGRPCRVAMDLGGPKAAHRSGSESGRCGDEKFDLSRDTAAWPHHCAGSRLAGGVARRSRRALVSCR